MISKKYNGKHVECIVSYTKKNNLYSLLNALSLGN